MKLLLAFVLAFIASRCGAGPTTREPGPAVPSWAKVAPEQIAEARIHGVPVAFENEVGMRFVLIPAGVFLMGTPPDEVVEGHGLEADQHTVELTQPYYMQVTEVTNKQYRRYMAQHDSGVYEGHSLNGEHQPVVKLTWVEARGYAAWATLLNTERQYRLPTEAEWEYACRAGTTTRYSVGEASEDLVHVANFSDRNDPRHATRPDLNDGHGVSAPVGSYLPNAWGLYDMHGNAEEWCADRNAPYPAGPVCDPKGPAAGSGRNVRGGCWAAHPRCLQSASRWFAHPRISDIARGFRLVSPLPEKAE